MLAKSLVQIRGSLWFGKQNKSANSLFEDVPREYPMSQENIRAPTIADGSRYFSAEKVDDAEVVEVASSSEFGADSRIFAQEVAQALRRVVLSFTRITSSRRSSRPFRKKGCSYDPQRPGVIFQEARLNS